MKETKFIGTHILLIGQTIFCLSFLSACEIPNWIKGPYSATACSDRWMFAAGLLFPSGLQPNSGSIRTSRRDRDKPESPS